MAKRNIIRIDEEKCTGCGACIPNCHEGALQIIDNKARLISDLFCDGLGACIGHCSHGAIEIEKREAEAYDERKVMEDNIVPKGKNTILAHLEHLKDHNANEYLDEALDYLKEKGIENPLKDKAKQQKFCGCPGSKEVEISPEKSDGCDSMLKSQLRQWPVQLHLANPIAPYFDGKDLLIAADCTAYAYGNFHSDFLKGKSLVIACPKLDSGLDVYKEKIKSLIIDSMIKSITVVIMEVPCCSGLAHLVETAVKECGKDIKFEVKVIGIEGNLID